MKNKFILFDFDGVIADSFEIAFETKKDICPGITREDYRRRFEGNVNDIQIEETYHNEQCNHDLDWFDVYVPKMKEVRIFPGMEELIFALEKEYALIIISSTITFPIEEFLVAHNLRDHFDWVMGNDVHKSKVEKIKMVFDKYGAASKDCLFITDTLGDMREAEETGVPAIGVTWGFCSPETLQKGNPLKLVSNATELKTAITDHFSANR